MKSVWDVGIVHPMHRGVVIVVLVVLVLWSVPGWADYTARQTLTAIREGQRRVLSSRVYAQGEKMRIEVDLPDHRSIRIARKDKDPVIIWTVFPEQQAYQEAHEAQKMKPKKELLGVEQLEGYLCNKYRISLMGPEGVYTGLQWEAVALDAAPIRQEYHRKDEVIVIELKEIKEKPLDPSLFEIPADYRKVTSRGSPKNR